MKQILLTFDVEEFDFPTGKNKLSEKHELEISKAGLTELLSLLDKYKIKATFFTTANFAKAYPKLMQEMHKKGHEIACHGYCHSENCEDIGRIKEAKKEIEEIIGSKIKGFRAPRFQIRRIERLSSAGFVYDSSIHPTIMPGRYVNCFKNRKTHKICNITEIPVSTLPLLRLPIAWIAFKNFGLAYSKAFLQVNSLYSDYTMLLFHPWEFANLKSIKIPRYVKTPHSKDLLNMLEKFILFSKKKKYNFSTVYNYLTL